MKHLLIILSFLLLSFPVIGDNHKGETLYGWETSSGEVWKYFGDKQTHPVYKGQVRNGKPNGHGVLIYPFSGISIIGVWEKGKELKTEHIRKDGRVFGKFEMDKSGQVTFTTRYGHKYVGELKYKKNEYGYRTGYRNKYFDMDVMGSMIQNMWKGTIYYKDGSIFSKVENGFLQ